MRERPIIFSARMVRAILAGTKTKTRRMVKPVGDDDGFVLQDYGRGWWPYRSDDGESPMKGDNEIPHACPYGQPGDRLWVRETWRVRGGREYEYQQDQSQVMYRATHHEDGFPLTWDSYKWRPSIHMPRWASRITLEITGVRVERLQDISEADAIAEGIEPASVPGRWRLYGRDTSGDTDLSARVSYHSLWESINGPGSWDANPWVWVLEFKRVDTQAQKGE